MRSAVESGGFILAGLDYLHSGWTGDQHAVDVATGATALGALSWVAVVNRPQFVGFMHLCHLAVVLLNLTAGTHFYGKQ